MTAERARNAFRNALLAFVLISIGFALGKETTAQRPAGAGDSGPLSPGGGDRTIVHYLHATFRCATCNEIERLAKTLVQTEFAEEMAAGRVEWREANFQEQTDLAKRYEVVSSCVVVASIRDGREVGYERLDDVWIHYADPPAFNEYVGAAIRKRLDAKGAPE